MKTSLTILAAVILSVTVTLLIQRYAKPASKAPEPHYDMKSNVVNCGLDVNGHIVPDGKGGCILPPPDGYFIEVPKTGAVAVTFDMSKATPICDRAVGARDGKCIDNDGKEIDRSEYDRRPTHTGEPVPFCEKGANMYDLCWNRDTRSIVNKNDYEKR
jgi:hypothetical protein